MKHSPHQSGFTIVEVVSAAGVLALTMIGIALLQASATRMDRMSQQMASATSASRAKIVEIEEQDPAYRSSSSDTYLGFERAWTLTPGVSPNTSALTVSSTWTNVDGRARQVSLTTIIAD